MPLSVLVPLVVGAVAVVAALLRALGSSGPAPLDADSARERFLVDHPEARVADLAVGTDGASAPLWLGGEAGVVFAVGDRFATRLLRGAQIERCTSGLKVVFGDVATPPFVVAVTAPEWWERLGG